MNDQLHLAAKPAGEQRYLTEAEAAHFTRFAKGTLRNMRSAGRGPRFVRIGSAIRYRTEDLVDWIEGGSPDRAGRK